MRTKYLLPLAALLAIVVAIGATVTTDFAGVTWRFRSASHITLDANSTIADEDAGWTLSNVKLGYLAGITSPIQTQLATKPSCVVLTGTATVGAALTVTQSFSTAFSGSPVVMLTASSNMLQHLNSVTKSNFVAGAAVTGSVQWVAIYQASE